MNKIILLGLVATVSFSAPTFAEKFTCNPDGNQNEMAVCADNEYKAADKALNTTWKALIEKNKDNKSYLKHIKISQNLWIKFRDAEVAAQFACDDENARTCWGSMLPLLQLTALTDITEERTKRLQSYIDANPEAALTSAVTPSQSDCYLNKGPGEDQAAIQIDQDGDVVTGYLTRMPDGKDGAYGELKGSIANGIIQAEYTYDMEGYIHTQEVQFRVDAKSLTEGNGELIDTKGKLSFTNPDNLQWGDVYSKTDCANVKALIAYSHGAVDALRAQQ